MNISPEATVLHLSFDDEPFGRADIFCGKFTKRQIANKHFIPVDHTADKLPFKDKQFDFVYASHVLQYVNKPVKMLNEIKRISRAAHIKEHSEFAEMLFGWNEHKWVLNVENGILVIKDKNPDKYGRFGCLFHQLYHDDTLFYDTLGLCEGILKIGFDWFEEDDQVMFVVDKDAEEEFECEDNEPKLPKMLDEIEDDEDDDEEYDDDDDEEYEKPKAKVKPIAKPVPKVKKTPRKKIVKTIFRPAQTEYFDDVRVELGEVSNQVSIAHLRKEKPPAL